MKNTVCKTKYIPDDGINRGLEIEEKVNSNLRTKLSKLYYMKHTQRKIT